MYLQKRNNIYYVRYYEFGKDIKKSLYTSSRKIATMKVREFLLNQGSNLIKYKNLDISSFIKEIQHILGEYQDRALSEFGEIETARFEAIGRFNEESISKKLEEYENLIFDIKNKNLIANEALKIIKRDKALTEFLKQLSQKEEKELFFEMLLKIEAQVLKTDLYRVEQFRDLKSFEIKTNTAQNTPKNEEKPLNHTNLSSEALN